MTLNKQFMMHVARASTVREQFGYWFVCSLQIDVLFFNSSSTVLLKFFNSLFECAWVLS